MIRRDGDCLRIEGAATLDQIGALLDEGVKQIDAGVTRVDMSGVTEADSGALALLLAWMRASQRVGRTLAVVNLAPGLDSLASLYGVDAFLRAES